MTFKCDQLTLREACQHANLFRNEMMKGLDPANLPEIFRPHINGVSDFDTFVPIGLLGISRDQLMDYCVDFGDCPSEVMQEIITVGQGLITDYVSMMRGDA